MKISAVIFTQPKDYEMAGWAGRSLRNCGATVHYAIDAEDPRHHIDGGKVITTAFDRKGNLNGLPCALGILDTLAQCAGDAAWVLKVDSDTLVHGLDWLAVPSTAGVVGTGYQTRILYGACYAVRPSFLQQLRKQVDATQASKSAEILIGNAAAELGILHRYELHQASHMGPFNPAKTTEEQLADYQAICVQRTSRDPAARAEVVEKMKTLYLTKWNR